MPITGNLEAQCRTWAKPASETEEERCDNAERMIRAAIAASDALRNRDIRVISQGSYKNNTNVRLDSDVDIGVVCYDTFFYDTTFTQLPEDQAVNRLGIQPATYHYPQFRADLEQALRDYFPAGSVTTENKHFDIKANSYRVEADVAPFFEHRRYSTDGSIEHGVELRPASQPSARVINWPAQHYENGVGKNKATGGRFKSVVRVFKNTRNRLPAYQQSLGSGFLCECLVWNVPNTEFGSELLSDDVRKVVHYLWSQTKTDESCSDWGEVSELKYLFRPQQKWTRQGAHDLMDAIWDYLKL